MNILIAFGSTEGQTRKIARHIESRLKSDGHTCALFDCEETRRSPEIDTLDAVIIAGSVHDKRHQRELAALVFAQREKLNSIPSAFISVSLSIISENGREEAQRYVDNFLNETGWTPSEVHLAAGAVRFLEYDFFKEFTVKQLVLHGQDVPDRSEGNPEYTDWDAIDEFVGSFIGGIRKPTP